MNGYITIAVSKCNKFSALKNMHTSYIGFNLVVVSYVELFINCGVISEECRDCLTNRIVSIASKDD